MYHGIDITNYRCFSDYRLHGLGRVNLLVGMNNSGKSSLLEAIRLLSSEGDPSPLWHSMRRRGERMSNRRRERPSHFDISHHFHGHQMREGESFSLKGVNHNIERYFRCEIVSSESQEKLFGDVSDGVDAELDFQGLAIHFEGQPEPYIDMLPLTGRGGISSAPLRRHMHRRALEGASQVKFITTDLISSEPLSEYWQNIALTPEEDLVLQALRVLEPSLERIAIVPQGVLAKLHGDSSPVPLGSMGEGMWRMLGIALAVIESHNSVLLVDEIDTGLHHTVMADMWDLVIKTAERLDVQVFATTHSYDCVQSLADSIERNQSHDSVTIQRIEKDKEKAIPYSENEIVVAARRGTEVR